MNLYLISQDENDGYDTYDSAVVAAPDEETARNMEWNARNAAMYAGWCSSPSDVTESISLQQRKTYVEYIGQAGAKYREPTVICASFNAR